MVILIVPNERKIRATRTFPLVLIQQSSPHKFKFSIPHRATSLNMLELLCRNYSYSQSNGGFVCIGLFPYLVTMYALAGIGPNLSCGNLTTVQPTANPMFGHIAIGFCNYSFFAIFF